MARYSNVKNYKLFLKTIVKNEVSPKYLILVFMGHLMFN